MASKDLVGLKPGTSYVVQVQAVGAGSSQVSDWSTAYTFVTPGAPAGTTNVIQSTQIGKGASLFLGNPPMTNLIASNTSAGGQSGLIVNDNSFQALKADGSALMRLSVVNDSILINAANFSLDSANTGNVLTIGSTGNNITMDANGNVTIGGTLTTNAITVGSDYWNSTGFQLGGGNGISYAYSTDVVQIGNAGAGGISVASNGNVTIGGNVTVSGNSASNLITGAQVNGNVTSISGGVITTGTINLANGVIISATLGAGAGSLSITNSGITIINDSNVTTFSVDSTGSATFAGNISASSGTFGGITINSSGIYGTLANGGSVNISNAATSFVGADIKTAGYDSGTGVYISGTSTSNTIDFKLAGSNGYITQVSNGLAIVSGSSNILLSTSGSANIGGSGNSMNFGLSAPSLLVPSSNYFGGYGGVRNIWISNADPSGGDGGDVWLKWV